MHSNRTRRPRLTAEGRANNQALVDRDAAAAAAPPILAVADAPPPDPLAAAVTIGTVRTL